MLGWIVAVVALFLVALAGHRMMSRRRRQSRRRLRRQGNIHYQKLWDQIMVKPRKKRLTFDDRPR